MSEIKSPKFKIASKRVFWLTGEIGPPSRGRPSTLRLEAHLYNTLPPEVIPQSDAALWHTSVYVTFTVECRSVWMVEVFPSAYMRRPHNDGRLCGWKRKSSGRPLPSPHGSSASHLSKWSSESLSLFLSFSSRQTTSPIDSIPSLQHQLRFYFYNQKRSSSSFNPLPPHRISATATPSTHNNNHILFKATPTPTAKIGGSQALSELVLRLQSTYMLLDHLTDAAHSTDIMASRSFFNPSPTVVLPPPVPDQYFGNHYLHQNQDVNDSMMNDISSTTNGIQNQFTANNVTSPGTSSSLAGRKRSRGDIFSEVEEDDGRPNEDGSIATPTIKEDAPPQFGACAEERTERDPSTMASAKRPPVTSRKSQRMDSKASLSGSEDLAQLVLPHSMREATTEPLIDEATRSLGISWIRMDSSEGLQISQRAYAKWIQNHYPRLTDVAIWLENSALPAYLVTATNVNNGQREYYIFSNDLTEARLVTTDTSQLIPRLRMLPALELAAPGGKILAETDPITASQNEVDDAQVNMVGCAAHAMEMD